MSQEICQECGKPQDECVCGDRPSRVIEIKHTGFPKSLGASPTDSPKEQELKAKLDERETQLELIALKRLEKEKKSLLDTIEDPKKKAYVDNFIGEDPAKLESVKVNLALLGKALGIGGVGITGDDNPDDIEEAPPVGSARGIPKRDVLGTGLQQIDKIYSTLENKNATEQERVKARRKADQLMDQFIKGRQKAIQENPKHEYYLGYFVCPKCDKAIPARRGTKRAKKCPHCDVVLTQRQE